MKIPMVDLKAGYQGIKKEVEAAIAQVLERTDFILGDEVRKFETAFAAYCGTKYAVSVANGTDALRIALLAAGIGKGDEVITTPFTFIATTEAIVQSGATPVFADIVPDTYTINPADIEKRITGKTRAVLPVHLYGHPADMAAIMRIAGNHGLKVIEDCAQSFTARYTFSPSRTLVTGAIGDLGCFSFFPAKNLGCFGDGGMVTTSDERLCERVKMLRNHGMRTRYVHEIDGFNSRLDTLQAAVLRIKLGHIDRWTAMRNAVAATYARALAGAAGVPVVLPHCFHSFNYYNVAFPAKAARDKVRDHLASHDIACQIYYPISLHLQEAYRFLGYKKGDFPVAERMQDTTLSLPMYPELTDEQIDYVAAAVRRALED